MQGVLNALGVLKGGCCIAFVDLIAEVHVCVKPVLYKKG